MVNIAKYLSRYHHEEEVFTVYHFSEGYTVSEEVIILPDGVLTVSTDIKGYITELTSTTGLLSSLTHNELLYVLNASEVAFTHIDNLQLYKLSKIKNRCLIRHNDTDRFYYF